MALPYPRTNSLLAKHPDVAAEWHPTLNGELDPGVVTASSPLKVMWKCSAEEHVFPAVIRNRTYAKSRCPVCTGRRIVAGVNDLATTHPGVSAQWHPSNKRSPAEVGAKSETKFRWRCPIDGYEWDATPASRTRYGKESRTLCPVCVGQAVKPGVNDIFTTVPRWRALWSSRNQVDPMTITARHTKIISWTCPVDGYTWEASPSSKWSRGTPTMCPACSGNVRIQGKNDLSTTHPELVTELKHPSNAAHIGPGSGITEWVCDVCEYAWSASVSARTSRGSGCPVCAGKAVKRGYNDLATLRIDLAEQWHPDNAKRATEVTLNSNYRAKWQCVVDPSHIWVATVNNRVARNSGCGRCWETSRVSRGEREVAEFLSTDLGLDVRHSVRGLLADKRSEIDIFIPSMNTAVEYNGAYYHSTAVHSDPNRHRRKYLQCHDAGIALIQVWDDDWRDSRGVVEHMLRMKLGHAAHMSAGKVFSSLIIREEAARFLDSYHIRGHEDAAWYVGQHSAHGALVSVLAARPTHAKNTVEIVRYASSHIIAGGFSDSLEYLAAQLPERVNRITARADLEVSTGNVYVGNGFSPTGDTAPDYRYLMPSDYVRRDRRAFTARRFKEDPALEYEDGMSEEQLGELNGLYRCYNSGYRVFEKRV